MHRSIGVAFQSAALFNSLNVEDKVALPLREHTRLAPSIIELVFWIKLAAVGLADRQNAENCFVAGIEACADQNRVLANGFVPGRSALWWKTRFVN